MFHPQLLLPAVAACASEVAGALATAGVPMVMGITTGVHRMAGASTVTRVVATFTVVVGEG